MPPYGYGGYGPGSQAEHPQATTVLVLGILGLLFCQVLGPVAWNMGNSALREIDAAPGRYSNRGNVQLGRVLGIVATVLLGVTVVALIGFFLLVVSVGTTVSELEPTTTTTLGLLTWLR